MASDDETIDRLTDEELDELTSPDDNPDEAEATTRPSTGSPTRSSTN